MSTQIENKPSPLIESLLEFADPNNQHKGGRGVLAKLRRGLGKKPGEAPEMFPYVVPYLPKDTRRQADYFLVAALFALHPPEGGKGESLGEAMRQVYEGNKKVDSIEKRFNNLLNADTEDLPYHLRQAISLCKSKAVAVDYDRLLKDLGSWEHEDHFVQLRWAREFWRKPVPEQESE